MELFSLNSPRAVSRMPSLSGRRAAMEKSTSFFGQPLGFPSNGKRQPDARNACFHNYRPRSSVSAQVTTGSSAKTADAIKQEKVSKDNDLVFVAGATGRVGSRTVRELLRLGFRVRAGVRCAQRAETLVQSVRQMKLDGVNGNLETRPVEKLEIIECDLENKSSIGPAIGNASVVICCIGASEKEVFDITGPYRIDYKASKNLIEAATVAEVDYFILLTSLGTNKFGLPAAILNLFWGVLYWKRKAEEALISSGLPYTIVRPGGMERPTDSYKETHNIVLANEDTYFGGQVSNLQVAELMAFMAKHRRLSYCKVVEVIAETTAPLTPMEELLAKIPPQRELPSEPKPDPVPLNIVSEPTSSDVGKELGYTERSKANPQSPFTIYADLKPPTSPTPTPSMAASSSKQKIEDAVQTKLESTISHAEKEPPETSTQKAKHLSPYTAYADLKPPTSPTPTPSTGADGSKQKIEDPVQAKREPTTLYAELEPAKASIQKAKHLSPYMAYADLKPPTSPTPSTPSAESVISTSGGAENSTPEQSGATHHQQLGPLSPYTMYEDLKPPSSPVPAMPKY